MKGVEKLTIDVKWELEVIAFLSSCVVRNARVEVPFSFPIPGFSISWPIISGIP